MKKVLFIGEINVDVMMGGLESFPVRDREIKCTSFDVTMGSSTAICACAYASLSGNASFLGLAGNDEYGDFMIEGLKSFNIDTGLIRRTDNVKTGVTVNLIFENTRTQVTYPGTISEFNSEYIDFSTLKNYDHIHIAGPYLQTKFIGDITSVLEFAKGENISTSLDPQWDSTETWKYIEEWLPLITYFFPNRDEALSITKTSNPSEACSELSKLTCCSVVKSGSDGALIYIDDMVETVKTHSVNIVDTTGAGDSFDAGFLYSVLERNMDIRDAVKFANAVAARSCLFVGGVNARSTYKDILNFLGE